MTSIFITLEDIVKLKQGFLDRVSPTECTSALGHIVVGFSWLEETLEESISKMSGMSKIETDIFISEMSFKNKIAALSSLVKAKADTVKYNVGNEDWKECWKDILKMSFKSEELRNKVLHSGWHAETDNALTGTKKTSKAIHGYKVTTEKYTSMYLLDIYDFILNVSEIIKEFFLDIDSHSETGHWIKKNDH